MAGDPKIFLQNTSILLIILLALSACGGGGGSNNLSSNDDTQITTDDTSGDNGGTAPPDPIDAVTIEILPDSATSGFGSGQLYRGQTFTVPPGDTLLATELTVYIGSVPDPNSSFRLLITEIDTSNGINPTVVLYESETINMPVNPSRTLKPVVVEPQGLVLDPGEEYALILDHFIVDNPNEFVSMNTAMGQYSDGYYFVFVNGPFFPSGTRQDNFASDNWFIDNLDDDLAFQLILSPL